MVPLMLVDQALASGQLVEVLPDWKVQSNPLHAVWPAGRSLQAKARAFVDLIAADLAAHGYGPHDTDRPGRLPPARAVPSSFDAVTGKPKP